MRRMVLSGIIAGLFIFLAASCGLAASNNYFPLLVGNSWIYRMEVDGQVFTAEIRVAQKVILDAVETIRVDTISNGVIRQKEFYSQTPAGVFTVMRSGFRFDPLQYFLKYPVVLGDSWAQSGKISDSNRKLNFTFQTRYQYEGLSDVAVPGGHFNALKLVLTNEVSDGSVSRTTRFFADGIGIVKEITTVELKGKKITVVSQLLQFNPGN